MGQNPGALYFTSTYPGLFLVPFIHIGKSWFWLNIPRLPHQRSGDLKKGPEKEQKLTLSSWHSHCCPFALRIFPVPSVSAFQMQHYIHMCIYIYTWFLLHSKTLTFIPSNPNLCNTLNLQSPCRLAITSQISADPWPVDQGTWLAHWLGIHPGCSSLASPAGLQ